MLRREVWAAWALVVVCLLVLVLGDARSEAGKPPAATVQRAMSTRASKVGDARRTMNMQRSVERLSRLAATRHATHAGVSRGRRRLTACNSTPPAAGTHARAVYDEEEAVLQRIWQAVGSDRWKSPRARWFSPSLSHCCWEGIICFEPTPSGNTSIAVVNLTSSALGGVYGAFPVDVLALRNVQELVLRDAYLTSWQNDRWAEFNSSSLRAFAIQRSNLPDGLPDRLGYLPNLQNLQILSSTVNVDGLPESLKGSTTLEELFLPYNVGWRGDIWPVICSLPALSQLGIAGPQGGTSDMRGDMSCLFERSDDVLPWVTISVDQVPGFTGKAYLNNLTSRSPRLNFLSLYDMPELEGVFPVDFASTYVEVIAIAATRIGGTIPASICSLPRLVGLYGFASRLRGGWPDCFAPGTIQPERKLVIDTSDNPDMTGTFPRSLGDMSGLNTIECWGCAFTGTLPDIFSPQQHPMFKTLALDANQFVGTIPKGYFTTVWIHLALDSNQLSGTLPPEFMKSSLQTFLSNNSLSGTVPSPIQSSEILDLSSNSFTGTAPSVQVSNFLTLNLLDNEFTAVPDGFLSGLPALNAVGLSRNPLKLNVSEVVDNTMASTVLRDFEAAGVGAVGTIPRWFLSGSRPWKRLLMNDNPSLVVELPDSFANLTDAVVLDLSNVTLSGTLPRDAFCMEKLQWLSLGEGGPMFSGSLQAAYPEENATCGSLTYLDLNGNAGLTGSIPDAPLAACSQLQVLRVSRTSVTGTIPQWIASSPTLTHFMAGGTRLRSELPHFAAHTPLKVLYLPGVAGLSGSISNIANLRNLTQLQLAGTSLDGTLPAGLGDMMRLQSLDVSGLSQVHGNLPDLSNLTQLRSLRMHGCDVGGALPHWLPRLEALTDAVLSFNAFACGVPDSWDNMSLVERFQRSPSCTSGDCELAVLEGNLLACPVPASLTAVDVGALSYLCGSPLSGYVVLTAVLSGLSVLLWSGLVCWHKNSSALVSSAAKWLTRKAGGDSAKTEVAVFMRAYAAAVLWACALAGLAFLAAYVNWKLPSDYDCRFDLRPTLFGVSTVVTGSAHTGTVGGLMWLSIAAFIGFLLVLAAWAVAVASSRSSAKRARLRTGSVVELADRSTLGPAGAQGGSQSRIREQGQSVAAKVTAVGLALVGIVAVVAPNAAYVAAHSSSSVPNWAKVVLASTLVIVKAGINNTIVPWQSRLMARFWRRAPSRRSAKTSKTLVFFYTLLSTINILVVPLAATLVIDERCLWNFWHAPSKGSADISVEICTQEQNYVINHQSAASVMGSYCVDNTRTQETMTFDYTVSWSGKCGSAFLESYGRVIAAVIALQGLLRPMYWVARDAIGRSRGRDAKGAFWSWTRKQWHHSLCERYAELYCWLTAACALGPAYPPIAGVALLGGAATLITCALLLAREAQDRVFLRQEIEGPSNTTARACLVVVCITHAFFLCTGAFVELHVLATPAVEVVIIGIVVAVQARQRAVGSRSAAASPSAMTRPLVDSVSDAE